MDKKDLDFFGKMVESITDREWKVAVNLLVISFRKIVVFDNLQN